MGPLAAELEVAAGVSGPADLVAATGVFSRAGVPGLVMPFVNNDDRDPTRYVMHLEQAGLGLPDEAYYREDQHAEKREEYVRHVERMLALAGWPDPPGAQPGSWRSRPGSLPATGTRSRTATRSGRTTSSTSPASPT